MFVNLRENIKNLFDNSVLNTFYYFLLTPEFCSEVSHIEADDIILVQIRSERLVPFRFQSAKQFARVARFVIVCAQHLCRHRLAEPPAAGDATVSALRIEHGVDAWYQRGLVNILVSHDVTEVTVSFINVYTHGSASVAGEVSLLFRCKVIKKTLETIVFHHIYELSLHYSWQIAAKKVLLQSETRTEMKTGKILILNASPRKRGNIAQMVAEMTDEAKAQGAEVEVIDVQKLDVKRLKNENIPEKHIPNTLL